MEEYLKDLEEAIKNGDKFYWQEDMEFLIEIIRGMRNSITGRIEELQKMLEEDKGHTHTIIEATIVKNELYEIYEKGEKIYGERM